MCYHGFSHKKSESTRTTEGPGKGQGRSYLIISVTRMDEKYGPIGARVNHSQLPKQVQRSHPRSAPHTSTHYKMNSF